MTADKRIDAVPAGTDPAVWAGMCAATHSHSPVPRYLEFHHIIPRAWQAFFQPAGAEAGKLWAPQTTPLCRTSHGNVHYWIEQYVRNFDATDLQADQIHNAVSRAITGEAAVGRDST